MGYCEGAKRFEQEKQHRGGVGGKSEGTQFSSLISLPLFPSLLFSRPSDFAPHSTTWTSGTGYSERNNDFWVPFLESPDSF